MLSKTISANFNVTKTDFLTKPVLVRSNTNCYLFVLISGFDQATHFTSVGNKQNFYNYKFRIRIPFYLKIENYLCEHFFQMKLLDNSITPANFTKRLELEKAKAVSTEYENKIDFSLQEEDKHFKITSNKEEALILPETETNTLRSAAQNVAPFDLVIKITDAKIGFKVDDIYMKLMFFINSESSDVSNNCIPRIIFTKENYLDIKSVLVLPFYEDEDALLKQQKNPRSFLQKLRKMKKSRMVDLFK